MLTVVLIEVCASSAMRKFQLLVYGKTVSDKNGRSQYLQSSFI